MAEADTVDMDKQSRLEQLKQAAEAQMRRPAPAIGIERVNKRQRQAAGAGAAAGGDEEAEAAKRVARYNYAAPEALLSGVKGFLMTCGMARQMSATKESLELIKQKLPPGASCSMVKVGCRGLVLMLVEQKQQQPQQEEEQQPKQEQEQQQQQQQEQQQQQQQQQQHGEGAAAQGQQQQQQQQRERRPGGGSAGDAEVDVVEAAASILADVESGATKHARFTQRIIPVQATCALEAGPLRAAAEALCRQYVSAAGGPEDAPIEFAVAFKNRGFEGGAAPPAAAGSSGPKPQQEAGQDASEAAKPEVQEPGQGAGSQQQQQQQQQQKPEDALHRDAAIKLLAEAMSAAGGGRARVSLKAPAAIVIAEVVPVMMSGRRQLIAALAVVPAARLVSVKAKGLQVRTLSKGGG